MFDTLSDRLSGIFTKLRGKGRLTDADIDATAREIRLALLEADVALPVVKGFIANVKERSRGAEVAEALNPAQQIIKIVNEELIAVLGGEGRRLQFAKQPPTVIMLAGLQGSGKTTLAGKLARWLKAQGHQPLLVAADLQRPNAVGQLQVLGGRAGVEVYAPEPGNGVGDPVQVAKSSIEHARRAARDVVIVDTAGRLGIDAEMMQQAADIRDAVDPDEVIFVIDAMVGQDAVRTAEAFRDGVGITGVVLSKLDGDARGGAALSVREVTGQPILFASTGEKLEDFDVFHPDRMASRILGMGDVLTLIEQAEAAFDSDQKEKMTAKLMGGEQFTLEDFLDQLIAVRRMGPIANVLAMMPGMGQVKDQLADLDDKHFDRITAIIRSMTPAERTNPKIINGSRRARIANGSGVTVMDVNQLLNRFTDAQKMMKQMGGMMGMPGGRRKATKSPKNKRKGTKGGNRPRAGAGAGMPGGFPGGMPQLPPGMNPDDLAAGQGLPPGFKLPKIDFNKFGKGGQPPR
ncbi:signal recognition particle subunit FFH/SRP54 (srp54) [Micromonospora phaseoli]|uniref:Signal recognition particle protein n=1 Tax=Micromonospora phaseoli TaxID=1144548 RepID=A0A1H6RD10_9ACTN|nr:signal recognition particle protein [Micromonospora phaseoli]PZW03433.1 signal recognition particle subunit FFH/SRP54 (srp54) [Micromonospora phaseoli]GIJ76999.1 signal recognition particle protein [Micromonospora phaseoli]SEI53623.1 signal recognition particle subunit FFH/SRP54 (srp54) [Micromonospora phaseoli]